MQRRSSRQTRSIRRAACGRIFPTVHLRPPASIAPGWKRPVSDRIRSSSPSSIVPRKMLLALRATCASIAAPARSRWATSPSRRACSAPSPRPRRCTLMMKLAFELGYRRYEWKCNALNAPSRAAALRLGLLRRDLPSSMGGKGRNRDTAWYAAIDAEWPDLERAFQRWLDPANFDAAGRQRESLSSLTGPILKSRGLNEGISPLALWAKPNRVPLPGRALCARACSRPRVSSVGPLAARFARGRARQLGCPAWGPGRAGAGRITQSRVALPSSDRRRRRTRAASRSPRW